MITLREYAEDLAMSSGVHPHLPAYYADSPDGHPTLYEVETTGTIVYARLGRYTNDYYTDFTSFYEASDFTDEEEALEYFQANYSPIFVVN